MHEMALAEGIIDIALDSAKKNDAKKITKIALVIGEMTGVETEALTLSFRIAAKDTAAEGAELLIRRTKLICRCDKCGGKFHVAKYNFFCPRCGDGILRILSGREMQVEYLEAD